MAYQDRYWVFCIKVPIHGFLETLRIENLKRGLHVMIIAPGFILLKNRKHALTSDGKEQGESPRNEEKLMSRNMWQNGF